MSPRQTVEAWIEHFNKGDAAALADLYHPDAVNHQVTQEPISGREAIRARRCSSASSRPQRWSVYRKPSMKRER